MADYVTAGKPATGGAIYRAASGTTLPTDASTTLASVSADYVTLGYCSEDGLVNSNSPSTTDIKAWGGDIVLNIQDEKTDTFQFTLIDVLRVDVLEAVYGSDNVSGDLSTGVTITANSDEVEEAVWVVEMVLNGDTAKRVVIPRGKISELGDISYTDSEAVGYQVTLTALPDTSGNTHYEYILQSS